MVTRSVAKESDLYKTELKPLHYLLICVGFITGYQSVMMYLWNAYPAWDWFLLRFSLSNSDAMGIAAFALAMWSLHLFYKNKAQMMSKVDSLELVNKALSSKMSPEELELVLGSVVEHELLPRAKRIKKIEEDIKRRKVDGITSPKLHEEDHD